MGLSAEKVDVSGCGKIDFRAMGIASHLFRLCKFDEIFHNSLFWHFKKTCFLELRAVLCYFLEKNHWRSLPVLTSEETLCEPEDSEIFGIVQFLFLLALCKLLSPNSFLDDFRQKIVFRGDRLSLRFFWSPKFMKICLKPHWAYLRPCAFRARRRLETFSSCSKLTYVVVEMYISSWSNKAYSTRSQWN